MGEIVLPIIVFLVTFAVVVCRSSKDERARAVKTSLLAAAVTTLATICFWFIMFGWSVAKTVYEDHQFLAAKNRTLAAEVQGKDATITELNGKLNTKLTANSSARDSEERARRKAIREQLGKFLIEAGGMKLQCEHWKQETPPSKQHVIEWSKGVYAYLSKNLDSSYAAQFLSPPTGLPISPVGMPDETLGIWQGLDLRITVLNKFIEELH